MCSLKFAFLHQNLGKTGKKNMEKEDFTQRLECQTLQMVVKINRYNWGTQTLLKVTSISFGIHFKNFF